MPTSIILIIAITAILLGARYYASLKPVISDSPSSADDDSSDALSPDARAAIGESAYATMTSRVRDIMFRHKSDKCVAVALSSGASDGPAADELHHLLPGDPLWLRPSSGDDLDSVEVFSGGYKIGSLLLLDADAALEVIRSSTVTGSYVCEQNCYEYYGKTALRIIIFFRPAESAAPAEEIQAPASAHTPYKLTFIGGTVPVTIFQN